MMARRHEGHGGGLQGVKHFGEEQGGLVDLSLSSCQFCVSNRVCVAFEMER